MGYLTYAAAMVRPPLPRPSLRLHIHGMNLSASSDRHASFVESTKAMSLSRRICPSFILSSDSSLNVCDHYCGPLPSMYPSRCRASFPYRTLRLGGQYADRQEPTRAIWILTVRFLHEQVSCRYVAGQDGPCSRTQLGVGCRAV